jgi:hypothetical protein
MYGTMDYGSWVLRRDELISEAAKIRQAQQARRNGHSAFGSFRFFRLPAASKIFITGHLRRQTP